MGNEGRDPETPMHVNVVGGNIVGGAGGTAQTDEAGFVEGTTQGTPIMGAKRDAPEADAAENTVAIIRITGKRGAHVNIRKADGTEIDLKGLLEAIRDNTDSLEVNTDAIETKLDDVEAAIAALANGSIAARTLDPPPASATFNVDTYNGGDVRPDQVGADAVLTFTFPVPMDLIWVKVDDVDCRADPFGGTPTDALGIPCEKGIPQPLTIRAAVVKVYAPTGATVHVWGYRYA